MSRSRRKTPICGWTTARSEKGWKQHMSRRLRRALATALQKGADPLPDPTKGLWGPKDGRQWWDEPECYRK